MKKGENYARAVMVLLFVMLACSQAFTQGLRVTGTVTGSTGETLPGVYIVVKGTTNGAMTDAAGKYVLENVGSSAIIQFSFIGYKTQDIAVNNMAVIDVVLAEDILGLEEVVVIGYGTQKKETLTGAITQIKSEEILSTKSTSVVSNIQGKLAGVLIRQQSGEPGMFTSMVSIRGFGTPLLVIDGVARDGMSDFERLNPEDIESISVLKDASAAIYGMNADNGVIIVTTKKGNKGDTKFQFNTLIGAKQPTTLLQSVDAYNYRVLKNEMEKNIGKPALFTNEELAKWKAGTEPGYQDYDWINEILDPWASQTQYNLSANGGNEKMTFYSSFGYLSDNGLVSSGIQKYDKYNLRTSLTANLSNHLKATFTFAGKYDENRSPQGSYFWLFKPIITSDRGIGPYTVNNPLLLASNTENINALAFSTESISGYEKWNNFQYQSTIDLAYEAPFLEGLRFNLIGAYDGNVNNWSNLARSYNIYNYNSEALVRSWFPAKYRNTNTIFRRMDVQAQAHYKNTFAGNHNVGATVVYEAKVIDQNYISALRQYDNVFTTDIIDQGSLTNMQTAGNRSREKYLSVLGRFNYDYRGKYLFEFLFRQDGSYRYAPESRWAFFPSLSAGWRLSEESFMDNVAFITNLKLRASYGLMGADAGNPFEYVAGYQFSGIDGGYVFNNNVLTMGAYPPGVVNNNLTWIKTRTLNIGFDLDMWNGRLGVTADVFQKYRDGLLATRFQSVPNTFGASFPQENLNSDKVEGFEFMVSHRNKVGDFEYGVSLNMTYARKYLINTERKPYVSSMEEWKDPWGQNRVLGREWIYTRGDQYTDIEQFQTAPLYGGSLGNSKCTPGSYEIIDVNGDGVINSNDMTPSAWAGQYQGYATNPPLQYGMAMNASWKGIDFNMLLQGSSLFTVITAPNDVWGYGRYPSLFEKFLDRWHTTDPNADPFDPATEWTPGKYPALKTGVNTSNTGDALITDMWRFDATYLRIKSVELGYTLPANIAGKIRMDNVRIFLNCFNLYTFCASEDAKGLDPEREEGAYAADLTYPLMRSFNFGFNINF
ncbi:MAG: TonB-dependent receptor [Bacteroidales bacterium]|jgi:TonB-linked SusC/RagA family outer membrane protein|nr:TonB-dependent receptor [Bacteroidales bacterium]